MKKLLLFSMILLLALTGCKGVIEENNDGPIVNPIVDPTEDPVTSVSFDDFKIKLIEYKDKVTLLAESYDSNELEGYSKSSTPRFLSYSDEEGVTYLKSYFMDVYNNQVSNYTSGHVDETHEIEFMYHYKDLLDALAKEVDDNNITELEISVTIDLGEPFGTADVICNFNEAGEIIVRIDYVQDVSKIIQGFKIGYDESENITLKQLDYFKDGNDINYNYQEYIENDSFLHFNYSDDDNLYFGYSSKTDREQISFQKSNEIEAEPPMEGYMIRWFDNEENIDYLLSFNSEFEIQMEHYRVFNDKGVVFYYTDYNTNDDTVQLRWNMLEAEGWDYLYFEDEFNDSELDGYYNGDTLMIGSNIINYGKNDMFAHANIAKDFNINELTEEELNLSAYGLTFSLTELDFSYIEQLQTNAIGVMDQYDEFGFYEDDVVTMFLANIDSDLLFDVEFTEVDCDEFPEHDECNIENDLLEELKNKITGLIDDPNYINSNDLCSFSFYGSSADCYGFVEYLNTNSEFLGEVILVSANLNKVVYKVMDLGEKGYFLFEFDIAEGTDRFVILSVEYEFIQEAEGAIISDVEDLLHMFLANDIVDVNLYCETYFNDVTTFECEQMMLTMEEINQFDYLYDFDYFTNSTFIADFISPNSPYIMYRYTGTVSYVDGNVLFDELIIEDLSTYRNHEFAMIGLFELFNNFSYSENPMMICEHVPSLNEDAQSDCEYVINLVTGMDAQVNVYSEEGDNFIYQFEVIFYGDTTYIWLIDAYTYIDNEGNVQVLFVPVSFGEQ